MTQLPSAFIVIAFLLANTCRAAALQSIQSWHLSARPSASLGGSDIDFHRVQGAAFLPDGIVVADGGNSRLLLFSAAGVLHSTLGRKGSGPGEFQSLWSIQAFGDTVLAYDSGLHRVTLILGGKIVQTIPIPPYRQRTVEIQAALSPRDFVGVTLEPSQRRAGGLFVDTVSVLHYDARSDRYASFGPREWRYLYLYGQSNGHTTYLTPFLPSSHVVASSGEAVFVPMTGAEAHILSQSGNASRNITLPIALTRFDRSVVTSYRDSLLKLAGSDGPSAARLRDVFSTRFPVPAYAPRVQTAVAVGPNVWIQAHPALDADSVLWYVIGTQEQRLVARVPLPATWQLLGGDATRVIVLRKDELDMETVAVYTIQQR
jgi:hypothetical protein